MAIADDTANCCKNIQYNTTALLSMICQINTKKDKQCVTCLFINYFLQNRTSDTVFINMNIQRFAS